MSDYSFRTIEELHLGICQKDFSSHELVQSCLKQAEHETSLNCFLETYSREALEAAQAFDQSVDRENLSLLAGIPLALKDVFVTKTGKSTCSSKMLEGYQSPFNATAVEALNTQGAIILGKTNMDEFAMGSSNENSPAGPVLNPWDRSRVPGGTSGGSAAAVACGIVPYALGTDTGGSVRQPAAFCNLTGIKPTYGRVSRYGMIACASSLDQAGVLARNVPDCAIALQAISGKDPLDSTSVDQEVPAWKENLNPTVNGLTIGIPEEYFLEGLQDEVRSAVEAAVSEFGQLGARVKSVSLPHTQYAIAAYYIVNPAEISSNLARYDGLRYGLTVSDAADLHDRICRARSQGFGPEVKRRILVGTYVLSSGYYDAFYLKAQKVRTLIAQDFRTVFDKDCDFLLCPTTPTTAFRLGEKNHDPLQMYLSDVYTVPVSLAGLPAMSIPCGFDGLGLPIGLQLIGKPWDEQTLLNAGEAYQQATDWHQRTPPAEVGS